MKNRRLKDSFKNAFRGIFQAFNTESNIRRHCLSGLLAIILAFLLHFNWVEWVFVITAITLVFVTELLNTAIEYTVDLVCGNRYNETAKYAKDIAAGATLLAAFGAIAMSLILYLPKILVILKNWV
ncbi:MAG: diacylglycerol kinase family protein [Vallitaleaceae bacterium]|nr:diacylglycerol kinase family protein [Vallitaleaceae bacterium]